MTPEAISIAIEQLYGAVPSRTSNRLELRQAGEKHQHGVFITPISLASRLVEDAFAAAAYRSRNPLDLKVLDPAMGWGIFLVEAIRQIGKLGTRRLLSDRARAVTIEIIEKSIYGVDRDPFVVGLARVAVWLVAASPKLDLNVLRERLRVADSLQIPVFSGSAVANVNETPASDGRSWEERFPEVLRAGAGFDVIISNPPRGRLRPNTKEFFTFLNN